MTRTQVTLLTVGDPSRVTGGYLFHRRLAERAPDIRRRDDVRLDPRRAAALGDRQPGRPGCWRRRPGAPTCSCSTASPRPLPRHGSAGSRRPSSGCSISRPAGWTPPLRPARSGRPFDRHAYRAVPCADGGERVAGRAARWPRACRATSSASSCPARIWTRGPAARPTRSIAESNARSSDDGRLMAAVCVANWLPRKGIIELLEAVAGLPDDVVTLHLVGDTATRGGYARRVRERLEQRRPS